jgi:hypothetical protein
MNIGEKMHKYHIILLILYILAMPWNNDASKTEILALRVTPEINNHIRMIVQNEELSISEWIRRIIYKELENNNQKIT